MATPILMPRQGQSVESCILVSWKVQPGDTVKTGQPVASIETDKATFDVECPADGTILELFFQEGDDIPVLTCIAAVGNPGEDAGGLRPAAASAADSVPTSTETEAVKPGRVAPKPVQTSKQEGAGTSPRARRAAHAAGIDPSTLAGTGPGGRVIERDVKAAAAGAPHLTQAARAALAGGLQAPAHGSGPGGMVLAQDLNSEIRMPKSEIPLKGIRKIIAERMRQSLSTTAQLTMTMSFSVTAVQRYRAAAKERGERVTINDLIILAVTKTLGKHPALNAHFLGDRIRQFGDVNLGIAVDTPRGLMVPVLRNADRLTLAQISSGVRSLADACQSGSISPDHLTGGTFTITNLGSLGVETFTPVLNAPEVAILGVGGIQLRPVKRDSGFYFEESITFSLTVDHQAVDGAPAARFLKDVCQFLETLETP